MRRDESQLNDAISEAVELDRRTVNRAMAWSVPVVMAAVAAPAANGSQQPPAPTVIFKDGSGKRGSNKNAKWVDFTLNFTSDQITTITLTSLTPDDSWSASTGETWPNRVVSLAVGANKVTFTLNRTGNTAGAYTFNYAVTGVSGTSPATINIA